MGSLPVRRATHGATRFCRDWYRRAMSSRIPALEKFPKSLARHIDGIISHCR
jgi:hypothetical protein